MDVAHRLLAELGEKDTDGNITLGGCKVEIQNGSVACLWKSGRTNRVAEELHCGFSARRAALSRTSGTTASSIQENSLG